MEKFPDNIEKLLIENYDCIKVSNGLECMKFVLDFIAHTDSVTDIDPIQVKCLTKVASHIIDSETYLKIFGLNSEDKLIPFLERVYWYNFDGACDIEFSDIKKDNAEIEKIKSHFLGHAAKIAGKLFDKTNELKWAISYYNAEISSAKISENFDRFHSFHAYSLGANIARKIYSLTKDIDWALKSYDAQMSSSKISESFDTRHCGFSLGFAADIAHTIFKSTKDLDWAKKAYNCYVSGAKLLTSFKPNCCAYFYYHAGEIAQNIYNQSKEPTWKDNSINGYNECISNIEKRKLKDISHLICSSQKKIDELNCVPKEEVLTSTTFSLRTAFEKALDNSSK